MSKQDVAEVKKPIEGERELTEKQAKEVGEKLADEVYNEMKKAGNGEKNQMDDKALPKLELEGDEKGLSKLDKCGPQEKCIDNRAEHVYKKDSVKDLPTGDTLVRSNGREILLMPNGDTLTVYPSGAFDLRAEGDVRVTSKGGMTTLTYDNGDTVSFDTEGVRSVQRGKEVVSFPRRFERINKDGSNGLKEGVIKPWPRSGGGDFEKKAVNE